MRRASEFLIVSALILVLFPGFQAGLYAVPIESTWGPGESTWNTAGNWDPAEVPSNGVKTYNVRIDNAAGTNSTVTLNTQAKINNLTIDLGDSLDFQNSFDLTIVGNGVTGLLDNAGEIRLNASSANTILLVGVPELTVTGGGEITLGNNSNNSIHGTVPTNRLVIENQTIQGAGNLGANALRIENNGLVQAHYDGGTLFIDPAPLGDFINNGTIRATGGGIVGLRRGPYVYSGNVGEGGLIEALDGSRVDLTSATLTGGTLDTTGLWLKSQ